MNDERRTTKGRIIVLPPQDTYANAEQLAETLATVVRQILIRRQQQSVVQSEQKKAA